jgi:hexosaminidase
MPWRDADHGLAAARRGHDVVMTPHRSTYLDYPQSDAAEEPPGQAGAVVDLRAVHGAETVPAGWEPAAAARVLGTQGQLWTEYVTTAAQAEYLAFPRLAALADRAWNPASDWTADFRPALRRHQARLDALRVHHRREPGGAPAAAAR